MPIKHYADASVLTNAIYTFFFGNHISNTLFHAFKKHKIIVSFNTNNKIGKILQPTTKLQNEEKSGTYKMTCECGSIYIGQRARNIYKRHKEYLPPKTNIKKKILMINSFQYMSMEKKNFKPN